MSIRPAYIMGPRHYFSRDEVSIVLGTPDGQSKGLKIRLHERLLRFYVPALAETVSVDPRTRIKTLRLEVSSINNWQDLELPALQRIISWMRDVAMNGWPLDALPASPTLRDSVLYFKAFQLLGLDISAQKMYALLEKHIDEAHLRVEDADMLRYLFENSHGCLDVIAENLARFAVKNGDELSVLQRVAGLYLDDEVEAEQRVYFDSRVKYWRNRHEMAKRSREALQRNKAWGNLLHRLRTR